MDSANSVPEIGIWSRVEKSELGADSKKYHYSWSFDGGEAGFIVHKKNRKKYKMFKDSNDNGILDKEDVLISKGKLTGDFQNVKSGKLLPKNVDGLITAMPYELNCDDHDHDHDHDHGDCEMAMGINSLGIEHLSLLNAEGAMVIHEHGGAHGHSHDNAMMGS